MSRFVFSSKVYGWINADGVFRMRFLAMADEGLGSRSLFCSGHTAGGWILRVNDWSSCDGIWPVVIRWIDPHPIMISGGQWSAFPVLA